MGYLKNKIITILLFLAPLVSYGQWSYTFTDPCTLTQQTINMGSSNSIALNYFGNVQTFTQNDFTNGTFDSWMALVTQANSGSPCDGVTQVIMNTTNSAVVQNTLTVVTNIMSIMGGGMLPPAEAVSNANDGEDSGSKKKKKKNKKSKSNSSSSESSSSSNESSSSSSNESSSSSSSESSSSSNSSSSESSSSSSESSSSSSESSSSSSESGSNSGDKNQQKSGNSSTGGQSSSSSGSGTAQTSEGQGNTGGNGTSTGGAENGTEEESSNESMSAGALANSIANAVDGGDGDGGEANRSGSLIASGDIVVIDNRDNSNGRQIKVVSSITHANTKQNRIQGALFTYTSVTNDFSLTLYKSWINPKRTFNLVGANTTMYDFDQNLLNTTTALESMKIGKVTAMAGANFTIGKLGKRELQNLSAVAGAHRNFRVSPKVTTSALLLGVYSPFTQFYEGKWWDGGVLIVPFSSWDIQITKTFKYNISFTGVWHSSNGDALNYQILTGGKIRF